MHYDSVRCFDHQRQKDCINYKFRVNFWCCFLVEGEGVPILPFIWCTQSRLKHIISLSKSLPSVLSSVSSWWYQPERSFCILKKHSFVNVMWTSEKQWEEQTCCYFPPSSCFSPSHVFVPFILQHLILPVLSQRLSGPLETVSVNLWGLCTVSRVWERFKTYLSIFESLGREIRPISTRERESEN